MTNYRREGEPRGGVATEEAAGSPLEAVEAPRVLLEVVTRIAHGSKVQRKTRTGEHVTLGPTEAAVSVPVTSCACYGRCHQ